MTPLHLTHQAAKQLQKLPRSEQKKILKKLSLLREDPSSAKKLQGKLACRYSLRAWPYRIIFTFVGKEIIIESIIHRQSAYSP